MIEALRQKRIQKSLRKLLDQTKRQLPKEPIGSVLVVIQGDNPKLIEQIAPLAKKLNLRQEHFWIREFTGPLKPEELKTHQWSKRLFNWKGQMQHHDTDRLSKGKFDLVIGYFWEPSVYLDKIIAGFPNSLRVGIGGGNPKLYDLEINTPKGDWIAFEDELLKYLSILKLSPEGN